MENLTPLCEIGYKYGTDKCPQIRHTYTPVYYELLKDKQLEFKKVLELGIGTVLSMKHVLGYVPGASHKMWRDFFPNAQIYGVDIIPECMFEEERIETFLLNTTKQRDLKRLIHKIGSDLDLVVDDGPHNTRYQIKTARILLPLLKQDVIYIIEDSRNPDALKENLPEYKVEVIKMEYPEGLKIRSRMTDNNLVIVRK